MEIIIAKSLTPDESWKGTVRKTKPTILKLDVADSRTIHLFVEGKDVLYSVQKSDRITEDAGYVLTDTATNHSITSWAAEPGSYLISIRAGENSMGARVTISFKNDEEFAAWEEEQAALEEEELEEVQEKIEGKIEDSKEKEAEVTESEALQEAEEIPVNTEEEEDEAETDIERSIRLDVTWDTEEPEIGSTAHVEAVLTGYEDIIYSLQWQYSPDGSYWTDAVGEKQTSINVTLTEDNDNYHWRIVVYAEEPQE